MRPVHIVLLVLAGAVGGAVLMKVTHRPQRTAAPVVAQVARPAAVVPDGAAAGTPVGQAPAKPAISSEPAVAPPASQVKPKPETGRPDTSRRPSPARVRREAPKPERVHPAPAAAQPVTVAQTQPTPASTPAAEPPPSSEPAASLAPEPHPSVRDEPEQPVPAPAPQPEVHTVTLNAGILIPVRLVDGLSSERNAPGDAFTATLDKALVVDGFVIAERGARVEGRVVASDRGGRVRGVAALAIELTRLHTSDGQNVAIATDSFEKHSQAGHGQDAAKVGGGAAVGAIIGAIAGGGKGAAIGAGVGGAAGAGDVLLTRGQPATLPSETRISFRLRAPVTLTERRS